EEEEEEKQQQQQQLTEEPEEKPKSKMIDQKDVVVVKDQFEKNFGLKINARHAVKLINLSRENGKSIDDAIEEAQAYYKRSGQPRKNPYGAVQYAIETGWVICDSEPEPSRSSPAHIEVDDSFFDNLAGYGGDYS
ncbi:hypothetical protein IC620_15465, partial [Hazenella sp. IB182357]